MFAFRPQFKDTQAREDEMWGLENKGGKKDALNQGPYDTVGADGTYDYDTVRTQSKYGYGAPRERWA
jgi:hypothetical protein